MIGNKSDLDAQVCKHMYKLRVTCYLILHIRE